ncbi:hypothetical protein M5D96_013772, partial [Drosophila gunungcola]
FRPSPQSSQRESHRSQNAILAVNLIPRRSHTSRDLSRSQETFETATKLTTAGSGQEHETDLLNPQHSFDRWIWTGARDASVADMCRF